MNNYPFGEIEPRIQKKWKDSKIFKTKKNPNNKYYILEMFSYPSGDLHVGHLKNYVIVDLLSRYYALKGYDVLHPIGWDAFGLPAEEAAIKHKADPETWTLKNINTSRETLKFMGIGYDWDTEIKTCDKDYYKWTQWIFIKLFEKGLIYKDFSLVNWCTSCQTVLANEQVESGKCWRCKSEVIKRELEQWFVKITDYAQRLLDNLENLKENWPEPVIIAQKNWIGRSSGAEVDFKIENQDIKLTVFTTRPDTLWGVTYLAIAPEHKKLQEIIKESPNKKEVEDYIKSSILKTDIERSSTVSEKTGIFSGVYLVNPVSGEKVPLWVCDYVIASYGTGVVMAVPAHDQRDFEFSKKFNIPIEVVIQPKDQKIEASSLDEAFINKGIMINSGIFSGKDSEKAIPGIIKYLEQREYGRAKINYKLHNWLVSRQRYWGAPIPMIYCKKCGTLPVSEKDLPVLLPKGDIDYTPKGRSVLSGIKEFENTVCPKCGGKAKRDGDTLDTFVDSSWYQLRYPDSRNNQELISKKLANDWLPIDQYVGGIEHATGHLIYFRFITMFLYDLGIIPYEEPVKKLFNHGMVCGEDGQKMSKSKGNGVPAGEFVKNFGADVCRVTTLFLAPPGKDAIWSEQGVSGVKRFLDRIWRICNKVINIDYENNSIENKGDEELNRSLNLTIKNVTKDIDEWGFNTAIAYMMEFLNILTSNKNYESKVFYKSYKTLIKLLSPFAPHICEEIWELLGEKDLLLLSEWPDYDREIIKNKIKEIIIQVNGKLRGKIILDVNISKDEVIKKAKNVEKVKYFIDGKEIIKEIFIPNKLINFVIK